MRLRRRLAQRREPFPLKQNTGITTRKHIPMIQRRRRRKGGAIRRRAAVIRIVRPGRNQGPFLMLPAAIRRLSLTATFISSGRILRLERVNVAVGL